MPLSIELRDKIYNELVTPTDESGAALKALVGEINEPVSNDDADLFLEGLKNKSIELHELQDKILRGSSHIDEPLRNAIGRMMTKAGYRYGEATDKSHLMRDKTSPITGAGAAKAAEDKKATATAAAPATEQIATASSTPTLKPKQ